MSDLRQAIEVLRQGGIVIFPTDTAFGIGCVIDNEKSVERLFRIRKRPHSQATPVLFHSIDKVLEYVLHPGDEVLSLAKQYWPGPLTIVLSCKINMIPSLVRGGKNTLGVRIPNHTIPLDIIKEAGPILGPSANFHGDKTPYSVSELNKDLISKVDYLIEGETKLKEASTVIDCSKTPWEILREGALKINI